MSANAVDLFAGVNVAPPTANGQVLIATASGAAGWSNTIGAGGLTVTAGGLTVSAGGATITGTTAVTGQITATSGMQCQSSNFSTTGLGSANIQGNVDVTVAGDGFRAAEGSNAKQGTFALSGAATTVVANTSVTANSRIFLQTQALGTVSSASTLAISARTAGTSFTVTPSQSTDTSTVAYEIFEPG